MKALVLWAATESTNLGVRALSEGTAALLERVSPGIDIRYQGYGPGDAPQRIGNPKVITRALVRRPSPVVEWLRSFDLIVDTRAGDSFADIYGLKRLAAMSGVAEIMRRNRIPFAMGPQTVGPFTTRRGRLIGRRVLRNATVVMARDATSADAARKLGRPVDILTTDVVFALPVPTPARTRDVVLNVSGLLWNPNPHVDSEQYRKTVTLLCEALLARGRSVSLLPHVLDSPLSDNDVPACAALADVMDGRVDVVTPTSLTDVRVILASSALVIGSRMHACLNALSVGTPAIPLAYSRKFEPLLDDIGWHDTVDLRTAADPIEDVLRLLDSGDRSDILAAVLERASTMIGSAETGLRRLL